ncbi:bifunctional UDP-sugar hydrolase/5'-nucleotidase [Pullulanibacillus sp. KACC 23026]|uniref:bifunctional metallophosphatase/5'-nucleotidase n=1 Tax=Pullulanibacillus sp. KACC 23026 TaxID=3028315 RepID=UPI0023AF8D16|nr:bifunctional UDP-sugar hydrolase/5'-nucleotidase [Pullulanibacillus sp. KACC 23026]WEG13769.1 bifunctional UDP-sugar hydrolase/5'-nucleotidase [Pullulanibacillus sp. KACC 23026]
MDTIKRRGVGVNIHLFHTNDLHSHVEFIPKQRSLLTRLMNRAQEQHESSLLIDLGDHMDRSNPLTEGTFGKGNVRLLNEMDYDLVTIGNNEGITFTKADLEAAYQDKTFPILLANLFNESSERPAWCKPSQILDINGMKLGFVGVTADFYDFYKGLGWRIESPMEVLKKYVPLLKKQADVVVVLSHVGKSFDVQLAHELDGIDVILGSHSHDLLPNGVMEKDTLIVQAGKFGQHVGEVVLEINEFKQLVSKQARLYNVLEEPDDLKMLAIVKELEQEGRRKLLAPVTELDETMAINWDQESPFAELLAEGLKEWCQADIGMINSGVLLGDLAPGVVTKGELHRLCPHPLNPCRLTLKGQDLLELLHIGQSSEFKQWALLGFGFRGKRLGGLVYSGLTYEWDELNQCPHHVQINGEELQSDKSYTIGTADLFTFSHIARPLMRVMEIRIFMPEFLRDVLAWQLSRKAR